MIENKKQEEQNKQKSPRINLAFYGDNLEYAREAAWEARKSVTQYVNDLIAEDRKKNGRREKYPKVGTVALKGYYYLNGEYIPFQESELDGKTYHNVDVEIKQEKRMIAGTTVVYDVICIEGCAPIECELVSKRKEGDGSLILSVCQDWG